MALIWADRVGETSTTTGTGDFTLAGAMTSFQAFDDVCATNDTFYYLIEAVDANGVPTGAWEAGLGTYSAANTLTRTTVHASSNAGAAVNFSAGTKRVTLSATAFTAPALVKLAETEPTGASFSFTDIPGGYRDLLLSVTGRGDTAATIIDLNLTFNNDTGANYARDRLGVSGSSTVASAVARGTNNMFVAHIAAASAVSGYLGGVEIVIKNYRDTNLHKLVLSDYTLAHTDSDNGHHYRNMLGGFWRSTSAITRVDGSLGAGNFVSGSVASLYGRR